MESELSKEPNGELAKARAIMELVGKAWDKFGLPTILVAIFVAAFAGWVPSPLLEARDLIKSHVERDDERMFYFRQTCIASARMAKMPIESCNFHSRE